MANTTFSGPVISDNGFVAPSFTVAAALALTTKTTTGLIVYCTDANNGVSTGSLCVSDGTTFIDIKTGTTVTA